MPRERLQDPDHPNNAHTITVDLNQGLEQEQALMNALQVITPRINFPYISWRYLAVTSSSLSNPDGRDLLRVFDTLADWGERRAAHS